MLNHATRKVRFDLMIPVFLKWFRSQRHLVYAWLEKNHSELLKCNNVSINLCNIHDVVWQVLEAEAGRSASEREHEKRATAFTAAQQRVTVLGQFPATIIV